MSRLMSDLSPPHNCSELGPQISCPHRDVEFRGRRGLGLLWDLTKTGFWTGIQDCKEPNSSIVISVSMEGKEQLPSLEEQPLKSPHLVAHGQESSWKNFRSGLFSMAGVSVSLILYSLMQERIMTLPFGEEEARFTHSLFLVLCNRLVACFAALITLTLTGGSVRPAAPLASYAAVSLGNVVSSTCQYEALKYVSFPVQVLAKCSKMIPVMVWQTLINRKVYKRREYLQACAVAAGCGIFLLSGEVASRQGLEANETWVLYATGGVLLIVFLAMDGFTSTWQDHLFTGYQMELANQVLYTTTCSIVLSSISLVCLGKALPAFKFMQAYPEAWYWVLGISFASTVVQFFVTHIIKNHGALVFATIMTTRQWISILLSSIFFMHPLSEGQWFGTLLVFGALYNRYFQKSRS